MRVGWLADNPGYMGGAELTMAEFKAAAPEGVDIVYVPADELQFTWEFDRAVVGNCMSYPAGIPALAGKPVVRYHHDVSLAAADALLSEARHIFCSPLQRDRMKMEGECIPPALDLDRFRHPTDTLWGKTVTVTTNGNRKGAVCVGRMAYGKGLEFLAEYPEPVDVYSSVPIASEGSVRYKGPAENVAAVLSRYERFVFLPTAIEPFGRAVVEAWAAGLDLVINRNVGARYYIEEAPEKLESAARDFWRVVLG